MIEVNANLWEVEADVTCITTNGTVYNDRTTGLRKNVMGGGCALEAARMHPVLPGQLGRLIDSYGNRVYLLENNVVAFPTKEDVRNPSTLGRILASFNELDLLRIAYGWKKIALPRPGCGLGGLSWEAEVKPLIVSRNFLSSKLRDSLIIVDFPK
jgi:hypothetical protein